MTLDEINAKLREAKNLIEDCQRELVNRHACLGDKELSQAVARIDHVQAVLAVKVQR